MGGERLVILTGDLQLETVQGCPGSAVVAAATSRKVEAAKS